MRNLPYLSSVPYFMKAFLIFLLSCSALLLVGCNTVSKRIEEKSAVFNTLDSETQTRLKQSIIKVGDTTDMVYIALGHPNRIRNKTTSTGSDETWIYTMYWQEYEGPHVVGYRRHAYRDGNEWRIYYEPLREDLYRDRVEEFMRVIFKDGKVTAIEQTKQ